MKREEFEKWCYSMWENMGNSSLMSIEIRNSIWQYFHREFPREAFVKALFRYAKKVHNPELDGVAEAIYEFERLWNGDQKDGCSFCLGTGECQGGDACHGNQMHDCPICKGSGKACPTCGGSKEVACNVEYPVRGCSDHTVPCPDCKEQFTFLRQDGLKYPNERKGQQRQGKETQVSGLWPDGSVKLMFVFEGFLAVSMLNRRKKDRRKSQ